jgi:addiction module toxin, relE/stbE family
MLTLITTTQFRKDLKRIKKRGLNLNSLKFVLDTLQKQEPLPLKYRDHALVGNYKGFRECHIEPDWLLIYTVSNEKLILTAARTGSHSDLF